MEQIEVMSWQTLDALKQAAVKVYEVVGDLDTDEHMSVFCAIDEDFLELFYSEIDSNYIRRFEDEEELENQVKARKNDFGEEEYDTRDYYNGDEEDYEEEGGEEFDGYKLADGEEDDDF